MAEITEQEESVISVTIEAPTNKILKRIKTKTGISVSRLANLGLAFMGPRILKGEFQIVNGEIVRTDA